MATKTQPIITEEELWQALDDAAKPIDFEALIAERIIEKDALGTRFLILRHYRNTPHEKSKR